MSDWLTRAMARIIEETDNEGEVVLFSAFTPDDSLVVFQLGGDALVEIAAYIDPVGASGSAADKVESVICSRRLFDQMRAGGS